MTDEAKEIMNSVELDTDEPETNDVKSEIVDMGPVENTLKDLEASEDLYSEFSSFLEKKEDFAPDDGIKETISTGIDLVDAILGGGFAVGALCIIVGQPGSGKTMLAIKALGKGQVQYKGKMLGAFLDSEEATTQIRLANLGVKYPQIKPYADITVEKVFKFVEGLCVFKQEKDIVDTPSVVVWDSIANTLSQAEIEADDVNQVIGRKARTLSLLIPKYVAKCAKNNVSLIAVNQLRDVLSMGPFGEQGRFRDSPARMSISGRRVPAQVQFAIAGSGSILQSVVCSSAASIHHAARIHRRSIPDDQDRLYRGRKLWLYPQARQGYPHLPPPGGRHHRPDGH